MKCAVNRPFSDRCRMNGDLVRPKATRKKIKMELTERDLILARDMAAFSAAAYPSSPAGFGAASPLPGREVAPIVSGQFSAIVITEKEPSRTTIAVTGTRNLANFITDARCVQVGMGGTGRIKAHTGFKEGLDALWPLVGKVLKDARTQELWLTGHSLGAAIARLILVRLVTNGWPKPTGLVTIGEPRSLNRYGANFLDDMGVYSMRWVNKLDIVPRVPFLTLLPPRHLFWHCDHSIWITPPSDGLWILRKASPGGDLLVDRPWWKKIRQDLRGLRAEYKARNFDPFVEDHSADRYVAALQGISMAPQATRETKD